jgi:hypothetical protein
MRQERGQGGTTRRLFPSFHAQLQQYQTRDNITTGHIGDVAEGSQHLLDPVEPS